MNMIVTDFIASLSQSFKRKNSRDTTIFFLVLIFLCIMIVPAFIFEKKAERELSELQTRLNEFSDLTSEYNKLKEQVSAIEGKRSLSKVRSIIMAADEVLLSLGVKDKMKSIKGVEGRDIGGQMNEESAEVQIEKVTVNELIHIFYKIENAPMLLSIKKVSIKKSFTAPELLDVIMTISLFTGLPDSHK